MSNHLTSSTPLLPTHLVSAQKDIYCHNSGVLLGHIQIAIVEGHMTYLQAHSESIYVHPFYGLDDTVLMKKLESSLHLHQEAGWIPSDAEKIRLRLLTSSIMFRLGSIKQDRPTLPSHVVSIASAGRLLGLAKWFWYISSQRLAFPLYSVSGKNENLEWENFKHWLDSAYEIRHDWANTSRELKREAEKKALDKALLELKREVYRPVDKRKVWGWIALQMEGHEAPGTLETWKSLFLNGDTNITDWLKDDVEDLQFAIAKHCDTGHEVLFYINQRLNAIRSMIEDFYGSFTLLTKVQSDHYGTDEETAEEKEFFAGFDKQAGVLDSLPDAPKREDFATMGLFLQAQARWNILKKRWDQMNPAGSTKEGEAA